MPEYYEVRKKMTKDYDGIPREQYHATTCYAESAECCADSVDTDESVVVKAPFDEMVNRWSEAIKKYF